MKRLLVILRKEFKQVFRDKFIVKIIFLMPTIQLLVLPFAANNEIENISVGIIDHDLSTTSRSIINKMEFSSYFELEKYSQSFNEGLDWIENEEVDLIIEFPANFEKNLVTLKESEVFMAVNAVDGVKGGIGSSYAMQIIREENMNIRQQWIPGFQDLMEKRIDITSTKWYNPKSSFQVFMVPGILALLLTVVGIVLSSLNIVREKEIGTIEQLNVSPIKKYQFIIGKLVPFWVLGILILTIGLIVAFVIHGIAPEPNIYVLYIFAIVYLLSIVGIGFLISNIAETQQQAMMIAFFFMLVFIMLSGLFTPIESMPEWAQWIAFANPVTYAVDVMRMVLLKGAQLADIIPHLKIITLEGILFNILAIWSYRKQQ